MVLIVLMMVSILSLSDAWTLDSEKQTAAEKTGEIAADYSTGTETDSNVDSEEAADESTPTETEEEHVHRFTEAETVAPTCTEKGYTIYSCACGKDSYHADETDPLGHDWDDGIVTAEATADEEGSITYTCNICGEQKTETILKLDSIPEEDQDDIQIENNNSRIEKEKNPQKPVSDPSADLEYEEQWDRLFENIVLSGDWGRDLLAIAESQLGYFESSRNFEAELNEEGSGYIIHGWTRYGAWYGVPYGDWCAMFISFCLHYAGIAPDNFPYECGTTTWIEKLVDSGLFREDKDYSPKPGDLIFYDWEEDNFSDHVGIVFSVDEENNEITTIEGNQGDAVRKCDYSLNDRRIMGYGVLPVNPDLYTKRGLKDRSALRGAGDTSLPYMDENGTQQFREDYEVFDGLLEGGKWYAVQGEIEAEQLLVSSGEVNLVLCDGSILTAEKGIIVHSGASLNIWAQADYSGRLIATGSADEGSLSNGNAGIGGDTASAGGCGNISINGGHVTAVGGRGASGIGTNGGSSNITINGGADGSRTFVTARSENQGVAIGGNGGSGTVTINGGTVHAEGGTGAAGIGGSGRNVVINNGVVNASGGLYGSGIGGSSNGSNGNITINGGIVSAKAIDSAEVSHQFGNKAAAIGAGSGYAQSGIIRINGGTVFAKSYGAGAGIGGAEDGDGNGCAGGVIEINGAETNVVAMSVYGAGIGSGGADTAAYYGAGAAGGIVTVNNGFVFALSSAGGAGIGGGNGGSGGLVTVNGGLVVACGGSPYYSLLNPDNIPYGGIPVSSDAVDSYMESSLRTQITYEASDLLFQHSFGGAGIGGGNNGSGGTVTVNSGMIIAKGGSNNCAAVGLGSGNGNDAGELSIYDYAKVTYGSMDEAGNTSIIDVEGFDPDNDWRATIAMTNPYARIEPGDVTVSFNVGTHGTSPLSQSFIMGGTASRPDDPTEEGWFFEDWYRDEDCTEVFQFSEPVYTNITIYGKWIQAYAVNVTKIWQDSAYIPETAVISYRNVYSPNHVTEGRLTLSADSGWTSCVFVSTGSSLTFTEEPVECFQAVGWKLHAGDNMIDLSMSAAGVASLDLKEQSAAVMEAVVNGNAELAVTNSRTGYTVKKEWETISREYTYTDQHGAVQSRSFEWPDVIDHVVVALQHCEDDTGEIWETIETLELKSSEEWTGAFSTLITDADSHYRIRELLTAEERNNGLDSFDLPAGETEMLLLDAGDHDGNGKIPQFVFHHTEAEVGETSFDGAFTVSYDWGEDGNYLIKNHQTGSIFVEMVWEIDQNETLKPGNVAVVLQHYEAEGENGEEAWVTVEEKNLNEENDWTERFDCAVLNPEELADFRIRELDKDGTVVEQTDETGDPAEYVIDEGDTARSIKYAVDYAFDESCSTLQITNTAVKNIDVSKQWAIPDGEEKPESITVVLMSGNDETERKTLTEEDGWSWTFSNQPIYMDGEEIAYSVLEEPIVGYRAEVDAFDITNTKLPVFVELGAEKILTGQTLKAGDFAFQLRDPYGRILQTKTNDANGSVTFDRIYYTSADLRRDGEGNPVVTRLAYTIREIQTVNELTYDNHVETVMITLRDNGNGTISAAADKTASQVCFTNELEKTLLTVKATWADAEAHQSKIPASLPVHLYADGKLIRTTGLNAGGDWSCRFGEYNKYDSQHREIRYTLTAEIAQNWVHTVTLEDGQFTVSNVYTDKTYTITYKTNGGVWSNGSGEDRYDTHVITEGTTIMKAPTRNGYTFVEWKGSSYQPGDVYKEKDSGGYYVSDTLVAQWKRSPRTGDSFNPALWIGLASGSLALFACSITTLNRKKERAE